MQYLYAPLLAIGITVALVPLLTRIAGALGMVDWPDTRKVHSQPIPRVGGIAIAVGLLSAMLLRGEMEPRLGAYCAGLIVLLVFGVLDDRFSLSPLWKVAGQVLAASIVMYFGEIAITAVRGEVDHTVAPWLAVAMTLMFVVGATNAINLADGLDGLAGGIALLCLSGLALLALASSSAFVMLAALSAGGAVIGFLRFNTHPARVFMGDAGSQVLGFTAAVLSLSVVREYPYSAALGLLLLGVPIIDMLIVMAGRMADRRSPFRADRTHVHHRLLELGFAQDEAVTLLCSAQAAMLVLAWKMRFASDLLIMLVFAAIATSAVTLLRVARSHGWHWREGSGSVADSSWIRRSVKLVRGRGNVRWSETTVAVSIALYVSLVAVRAEPAPLSVRVLSAGAGAVLIALVLSHASGRVGRWAEQAGLYLGALTAVFVDASSAAPMAPVLASAVFGALVLAIVVRLWFSVERRFSITPLDLLVIVVGLALPGLTASLFGTNALGWAVVKALLLLYGIEAVSTGSPGRRRIVTWSLAAFMLVVTFRT